MWEGQNGTGSGRTDEGLPAWVDSDMVARVDARYPVRITPYYLALIDPTDPDDPLARQCIPDARELMEAPDVARDPYAERRGGIPGFVQRYANRALVMATQACALRCRHCTRKNLLARDVDVDTTAAVQAVRERPGIREVLVSGGDPLLLDAERLDRLLGELHAIPHVDVLRIGTRLPVVDPDRVDAALVSLLAGHRPLWVNTQFNHPRELTARAQAACERLVQHGIPVSNQAVLLRGVNDDADTLVELCNALQAAMIRPYYVFHGDPVAGTAHLRTELATTRALAHEVRQRLGGLACPRFVADVPGAPCKVPVEELQDDA